MIVASVIKVSPVEVVKRTSVPLAVGTIATLIYAYFLYA
ncbi:hypothetical protein J4731_02845 [Providencia rettgeri]|nr:hypothetical protein [Providencia rettgeri]